MPIYEYHCKDCGADFERLLKNREETVVCECGSNEVDRRMSVFAPRNGGSKAPARPAACQSCCSGGACELS